MPIIIASVLWYCDLFFATNVLWAYFRMQVPASYSVDLAGIVAPSQRCGLDIPPKQGAMATSSVWVWNGRKVIAVCLCGYMELSYEPQGWAAHASYTRSTDGGLCWWLWFLILDSKVLMRDDLLWWWGWYGNDGVRDTDNADANCASDCSKQIGSEDWQFLQKVTKLYSCSSSHSCEDGGHCGGDDDAMTCYVIAMGRLVAFWAVVWPSVAS